MEAVEGLNQCGGRATWQMLRTLGVRRVDLDAGLHTGAVIRVRRGCFRSAGPDTAPDAATAVTGVLSHRSAALHLGWEVATAPEKPEVIVRRNRRLTSRHRALVTPYYRDLSPADIFDGVTRPVRTVIDCARDLPLIEALSVADSALRHKAVTRDQLHSAVGALRGPGSVAAARVVREAHGRVANPFESSLRAIALDAGLDVVPQVQLTEHGLYATVDLADAGRRLAIEAESFEFHAHRKAFRRDIRRYSELVVFGWTVLRFTWEDVTVQPHYVRWALESWRRWYDLGTDAGPPPAHLPRLR